MKHLLRTKPQGEARAIAGITRSGHQAWTPTEERTLRAHRYSKKKRTVKYPLAPRYVVTDAANPHALIHAIDEVSGVVGLLKPRDVDRLHAMEAREAETVISKALKIGQPVEVVSGPLSGWRSTLDGIDGSTARITVDLLGKATPVTMPLEYLDPV